MFLLGLWLATSALWEHPCRPPASPLFREEGWTRLA